MWRDRVKDWGSTFAAAALLVLATLITVILVAPRVPNAIQNALYTGAFTLFFVGLMGGMLKILLEDVATVKRKREGAATFVTNVLADLKAVYDRVARARILIPAHKSVKTYGDEMRNLIEARVQLRNVTRALEGRAEGMIDDTREKITRLVQQMEAYLETLTSEFRDNYKPLSDQQRGYEEQAKVMLKCFAASGHDDVMPPPLPGFVWKNITRLKQLSDFIGEANEYKVHFETPLDGASKSLRDELARIIGRKSPRDRRRPPSMTPPVTPSHVRRALLLREEIALLDLRHEAAFATGHPLFAANMAAGRIELEAATRLPRKDAPVVVYDAGEGLVAQAAERLMALGYTDVRQLDGGLQAWQAAGYELFRDVNSYAKAFGELVEHRRHTPSLPADDVAALIASGAKLAILDVRRFDEYATMNIPGSVSVPGAELVLRTGSAAADPETTIIVNCAGRTRSIIGTQSLINAGVANKVLALRNGTIGWTLANQRLEHSADRRGDIGLFEGAESNARDVAYRAGVRRLSPEDAMALQAQTHRTLYRFDVRGSEDYAAGHISGFRHYPGGQLVQEIDMAAPVRGARILLTDDMAVRADMTASWLAQMGWETYVLDGGYDGALEVGPPAVLPKPDPSQRYRRPYEGTDVDTGAMQAYLDWEYGLVDQLRRDATHGFFVI